MSTETIDWITDKPAPRLETVLISAEGVPVDLAWRDGRQYRWNESGGVVEQRVLGWARRPQGLATEGADA